MLSMSIIAFNPGITQAQNSCPNSSSELPVLKSECLPVEALSENELGACQARDDANCQILVDRFAWQLFIALNWPLNSSGEPTTAASFGEPGDLNPVVWETYKDVAQIFTDKKPSPWDANTQHKSLRGTSAVTLLKETRQVDRNWLTDQDGNLVYYELRVNEDEFNYIVDNELYHQEGIYNAFNSNKGIVLPDGSGDDGIVGAIEIKAAWRIVPDGEIAKYEKRFKLSQAIVGEEAKRKTVALVGLHIIKKTPNLDQWTWSTFEHIDNAPDLDKVGSNDVKHDRYSFYNSQVNAGYKPNYNSPPEQYGSDPTPKSKPVQMVRVDAIEKVDEDAPKITKEAWQLIKAKNPDSVWLNYQLVSSQWPLHPKSVTFDEEKGILPSGTPRPGFLGNLTMESYFQNKNTGGGAGTTDSGSHDISAKIDVSAEDFNKSSCIGCHRVSAITPTFDDPKYASKSWFTDYSTIFFKAKSHKAASKKSSQLNNKKGEHNE